MSLTIGRKLGSGGWATTYIGTYQGKTVAIKMIDLLKFRVRRGKPVFTDQESPFTDDMLIQEIKALKALSEFGCSEYVVCFYDAIEYKSDERRYVAIITEYLEGEELLRLIQREKQLPPPLLWALMQQLLLGLEYIHNLGYAHRDIKPENVVLTKDQAPKYIDFGFACSETCIGQSGTLVYNPPEAFDGSREISIQQAQAKDIWALGVMFYEMAHGYNNFPFPDDYDDNVLMRNIKNAPSIPAHYTLDDGRTNKFLDWLIVNNWEERPTIDQAIEKFPEIIGDQGYPIVQEII